MLGEKKIAKIFISKSLPERRRGVGFKSKNKNLV
jgi:hypothetical protein